MLNLTKYLQSNAFALKTMYGSLRAKFPGGGGRGKLPCASENLN